MHASVHVKRAGSHQVLHTALSGQDARRSARAAGALRRHRDLAGGAHRRAERGALAGLEPRRLSAAGRERLVRAQVPAISAELSNARGLGLVATAVRGVGLGTRRSAAARLATERQRRVRRRRLLADAAAPLSGREDPSATVALAQLVLRSFSSRSTRSPSSCSLRRSLVE